MSLCFFFHPLNIHNKRVVLFSEFTKRLLSAPFHPENEGSFNGTLRVDSRARDLLTTVFKEVPKR